MLMVLPAGGKKNPRFFYCQVIDFKRQRLLFFFYANMIVRAGNEFYRIINPKKRNRFPDTKFAPAVRASKNMKTIPAVRTDSLRNKPTFEKFSDSVLCRIYSVHHAKKTF